MALKKKDSMYLGAQLKILGFRSYKEFLASSLWKEFKWQLIKTGKFDKCSMCPKPRHAFHHISYKALLDPRRVVPVCSSCHKAIHDIESPNTEEATVRYRHSVGALKGNRTRIPKILSSGLSTSLHSSIASSYDQKSYPKDPQDFMEFYLKRLISKTKKGSTYHAALYDELMQKVDLSYRWIDEIRSRKSF